ncbi:MAG: serine/threonine-protein phosphatase [Planctomyces sp.]|nr:serine/threonine-protein phosphatase [Planctomyces sp.]
MRGKMDCFGITDAGLKRPLNEDQFLIADLNKAMRIHQSSLSVDDDETVFGGSQGMMLLVADGMGGHAHGEQASRLAVESLTSSILNTMPWFFSRDAEGDEDLRQSLERALERCQERLQDEAAQQTGARGMGTTLTAAYIHWPRTTILHAGDSRCYLLRDGVLTQITNDHTMAAALSQGGRYKSSELAHTRWAHMLWNAIGSGDAKVQPEVHQFDLRIGDVLLLCTDGLIRHVGPGELEEALSRPRLASETCAELVKLTNARGGTDNVTVVVARFLDQDEPDGRAAAAAIAQQQSEEADRADSLSDTAPEIPVIPAESTLPLQNG